MSEDSMDREQAMVTCDVTGKVVRESETVMFRGKRVCAEGKAILLEQLAAGEYEDGGLERPSVLRRFGCVLVDSIILNVAGVLIGAAVALMAASFGGSVGGMTYAALIFVATFLNMGYYTYFHGVRGQTLGKMIGKLKVVQMDGSPINVAIAFKRMLYFAGPVLMGQIVMAIGVSGDSEQVVSIGTVIQTIGGVLVIATAIVAIADRASQRTIHDRLAGTRVIRV